VTGTDMTYELAQEMDASTTYGWLIVDVFPNSPAEKYGLKVEDIIIALNDTQIISGDDISSYLEKYTSPNQTIIIKIERDDSETTISLVLGTRPPSS
jgi:serine protease Do